MTELTKLDLNNQIVSMRHNIKRAKVHIAHKLTRQITVLRNKSVPDNIKTKLDRKSNRFADEILALKSIPDDEAAVFSLLNPKDPAKIIADSNSSAKLRVLSKIHLHKSIKPIVEVFRSKYPDWRETAPKVFVELKTKKKRKKLEATDEEKTADKEKDEENKSNLEVPDDSGSFHSSEGKLLVGVETGKKERVKDSFKQGHATEGKSSQNEFKKIKLNEGGDEGSEFKKQSIVKDKFSAKTVLEGALDPFFMTDNNQFYVTNVKTKSQEELDKKWDQERKKEFHKQFKKGRLDDVTRIQDQFLKKNSILNLRKGSNPKSVEPNKVSKVVRSPLENVSKNSTEDKSLHPSWLAKKKQQAIIPFAGKKITFD